MIFESIYFKMVICLNQLLRCPSGCIGGSEQSENSGESTPGLSAAA